MAFKLKNIEPSNRDTKRLKAVFYDKENDKTKTIHFGYRGAKTYLEHQDDEKKKNWIARHKVRGTFNEPLSASSLAYHILWNKKTFAESMKHYKTKFNL